MTPASIEELARQAGIALTEAGMVIDGEYGGLHVRKLARFAALVRAEALEDAAKLCDKLFQKSWCYGKTGAGGIADCADAIRDLAEKGAK